MLIIIKRKLYSKNFSSKSKLTLVIKRFSQNPKFYSIKSTKQTMRIKRFSQIREEERLYANPFAAIGRINALRRSNNAAYKGLNFFQAANKYRARGKVASVARDLHKSMVTNWAKNGKLDYRSLQGGILRGNNLGQSNLVGLSAGVKQAGTNISNNVRSSSGGGLFNSLFRGNKSADTMRGDILKTSIPITTQHINQSKNLVNSLQNAGVTSANIGNLTGAQQNQLLNTTLQKSTYNPALDPKTLNTNFMGSGQIPVQKGTKQQTLIDNRGFEKVNKSQRRTNNSVLNQEANQLSKNNQKGQSYYESVFRETGANANSMNNTTFSRSKVMEQQNPVKTQTTTQPTQPQEKPFEIVGLAENQPKPSSTPTTNKEVKVETPSNTETKTNTSVDNNNSVSQTTSNPTTELATTPEQPKPEGAAGGGTNEKASENGKTDAKTEEDKKFRLGWKGKLALGTAGLGAITYGGTKLVNNLVKDEDE